MEHVYSVNTYTWTEEKKKRLVLIMVKVPSGVTKEKDCDWLVVEHLLTATLLILRTSQQCITGN